MCLLGRHKSIHEDSIPDPINKRGRHRLKIRLSYARRPVAHQKLFFARRDQRALLTAPLHEGGRALAGFLQRLF
jgi:hypothetical protein